MGRKKKQKEGFDPTTTKDPLPADSQEVAEAVESFNEEQQDAISDLMDEAAESGLPDKDRIKTEKADEQPPQKTPEEPATQEQQGTPEAKEDEGAKHETQAKTEEQPKVEITEPKSKVPESSKSEKETAPGTEPQFLSGEKFGDYSVEIVNDEGARYVPLQNLVTTYQQFPHYQKRYQELKPVMDLAENARVTMRDVMPLLELGIQTWATQQGIVSGSQPPVANSIKPGGYQGPFADAEQDAFYKEADPDIYNVMHNMHRQIMQAGGGQKLAQIEAELNQLRNQRFQPANEKSEEEIHQLFDGKIKSWSGDHTDYFSAPNVGEVRLEAFKRFIIKNHAGSGVKIKDLTPQFLQAEFARFDPQYTLTYMQKIAQQKAKKAQDDSGLFSEGTGIRNQAEPLNKQQQHMDDLL